MSDDATKPAFASDARAARVQSLERVYGLFPALERIREVSAHIGVAVAESAYANGTAKTVHITPLTDLVARQLADATPHQVVAGVAAAQINAYNLQLAKLFGVSSTQSITDVLPTFVLDTAGTLASATQLKNAYAQALAQISDQAVVKATTLANIQDLLSKAITWSWNGTAATLNSSPASRAMRSNRGSTGPSKALSACRARTRSASSTTLSSPSGVADCVMRPP